MLVRVAHGIICSRIILDPRQAASSGGAFPTESTDLGFAASPWQRTNLADTVLLGTSSTCNENEHFQRQTDEGFVVGQGVVV